jgi:Peptidase family M23
LKLNDCANLRESDILINEIDTLESILGCLSDLKYGDKARAIEIAEANHNFQQAIRLRKRGPNPVYWSHTNFIVIMHSNGEYSRYDHLSYNSSRVKAGQHVKAGEEIARVGMTGYTYLPHLHFQVFVATGMNMWTDFDTLEVLDFEH